MTNANGDRCDRAAVQRKICIRPHAPLRCVWSGSNAACPKNSTGEQINLTPDARPASIFRTQETTIVKTTIIKNVSPLKSRLLIPLLIMTLMLSVLLTACGNTPSDLIIGKWKASVILGDPAHKQIPVTLTYEFLRDGTFSFTLNDTKLSSGEYELMNDGRKLRLTRRGGSTYRDITTLHRDKMVWEIAPDDEWIFSRVK